MEQVRHALSRTLTALQQRMADDADERERCDRQKRIMAARAIQGAKVHASDTEDLVSVVTSDDNLESGRVRTPHESNLLSEQIFRQGRNRMDPLLTPEERVPFLTSRPLTKDEWLFYAEEQIYKMADMAYQSCVMPMFFEQLVDLLGLPETDTNKMPKEEFLWVDMAPPPEADLASSSAFDVPLVANAYATERFSSGSPGFCGRETVAVLRACTISAAEDQRAPKIPPPNIASETASASVLAGQKAEETAALVSLVKRTPSDDEKRALSHPVSSAVIRTGASWKVVDSVLYATSLPTIDTVIANHEHWESLLKPVSFPVSTDEADEVWVRSFETFCAIFKYLYDNKTSPSASTRLLDAVRRHDGSQYVLPQKLAKKVRRHILETCAPVDFNDLFLRVKTFYGTPWSAPPQWNYKIGVTIEFI